MMKMLNTEAARQEALIVGARREALLAAAREHQRRAEEAAIALLGHWASGLEPCVAYDDEYRVIGLSYGGQIVLYAADMTSPAPAGAGRG